MDTKWLKTNWTSWWGVYKMKQLIFKEIYRAGVYMSYGRYAGLMRRLEDLQPGKPEDGTSGFLAYNVPGKDRMKMKTGRFLTRRLNLNSGFLSDSVIQHIASAINESLFPDLGVRLDKGSAITRNYRNEVGGHSCMTGGCAECTKLYEMNPDKFQQLIMEQNGDSARAIVHKLDSGEFAIDRVYATSEYLKNRMKEYAAGQGWRNVYEVDGGTVSGLEYDDNCIPYMDSMIWGTVRGGLLTISTEEGGDCTLQNTDGTLENGSVCCENCGDNVSEDNVYYAEDGGYCEHCYSERL
jgi:hypothetical protein